MSASTAIVRTAQVAIVAGCVVVTIALGPRGVPGALSTHATPTPTVAPTGRIGTPLVVHKRKHHRRHHARQTIIPAITMPPTDTEETR